MSSQPCGCDPDAKPKPWTCAECAARAGVEPFELDCGCFLRILPGGIVDQLTCAEHARAAAVEQLRDYLTDTGGAEPPVIALPARKAP